MPQDDCNQEKSKNKGRSKGKLLQPLLLDDVLLHPSNYSPKYMSSNNSNKSDEENKNDCVQKKSEFSLEISRNSNQKKEKKQYRCQSNGNCIPPIVFSTIQNLQKQCLEERQGRQDKQHYQSQKNSTREFNNTKKSKTRNNKNKYHNTNQNKPRNNRYFNQNGCNNCRNFKNNGQNKGNNNNTSSDNGSSSSSSSSSKGSSKRGVSQDGLSYFNT